MDLSIKKFVDNYVHILILGKFNIIYKFYVEICYLEIFS